VIERIEGFDARAREWRRERRGSGSCVRRGRACTNDGRTRGTRAGGCARVGEDGRIAAAENSLERGRRRDDERWTMCALVLTRVASFSVNA